MKDKSNRPFMRYVKFVASIFMLIQVIFGPILPVAQVSAKQTDSVALTISVPDIWPPEPVTDLVGRSSWTIESRIVLNWTAPHEDSGLESGGRVTRYFIKYDTFSITDDLSGDTTAWWNSAKGGLIREFPLPELPGYPDTQIFDYPQLFPGTSYYFAIISYDEPPQSLSSLIDVNAATPGQQALAYAPDFTPETPEGLYISTDTGISVTLEWTDLSSSSKTLDFAEYLIYRSTTGVNGKENGGSYKLVGYTVGPVYTDNIARDTTYYYRISAVDLPPTILESELSYAVTAEIKIVEDIFPPAAVTDLVAAPTLLGIPRIDSEGRIDLTWTAPHEDGLTGGSVAGYLIKYSESKLVGDTTAWWNAAYGRTKEGANEPGEEDTYQVGYPDILPGVTYYFAIKSYDEIGLTSTIDTRSYTVYQASAAARDDQPQKPGGLSIHSATTWYVELGWDDSSLAAKTIDFDSYRIYRSSTTDVLTEYKEIGNSPFNVFPDSSVVPNVLYYYRVSIVDKPPVKESPLSDAVSILVMIKLIPPREPTGTYSVMSDNTLTFRWKEVQCDVLGMPADINEYRIYRSTSVLGKYVKVLSTSAPTYTETLEQGKVYYYYVTAVDTFWIESCPSAIVDVKENTIFVSYDKSAYVVVPSEINNLYNNDRIIELARLPDKEEAKRIIQAYELRVLKDSVKRDTITGIITDAEEIKSYTFPRIKAQLVIHYQVVKGEIVVSAMSSGRALGIVGTNIPAAQAEGNLGIYRYDGFRWLKLGGEVDTETQTVSIMTANAGEYQLRRVIRATEFTMMDGYPKPKIITPNGDGKNDKVMFKFDNPTYETSVDGRIYDITGAYVNDIESYIDSLGTVHMEWKGDDVNGQVVPAGVYIYQVETGRETVSGTIVVAR